MTTLSPIPTDGPHVVHDTALNLGDVVDVLLLRDYNTMLVVLATVVLGLAAGAIGTFLLLRRRALMGDALSHAMLPGIAIAFMVMVAFGGSGKSMPGLLIGAAVTGLLGVAAVLAITRLTRLKDDAALGVVLSVFFGFGVALLGIVQDMPEGSPAGLASFIQGKTASIVRKDLWLILIVAGVVALMTVLLFKELALLCFDEAFASVQGWPVLTLDVMLLTLVTAVTVVGLQAVGLILIIALLIIPPAAARFWTERLGVMLALAALIGGLGGWIGASISALVPRLPAGAIIVIVVATIFVASMLFGARRGVVARLIVQARLGRTVRRQHLLRAIFEHVEAADAEDTEPIVVEATLVQERSWSRAALRRLLRWARRRHLLAAVGDGRWRVTDLGLTEAARVARNHRLWEIYLIHHADVAPSHVDRDADQIEHVLGPRLVRELERLLEPAHPAGTVPPSPHVIGPEGG
ncbi:MAG: iron chelate uptake ABC transporter family permease subunit [Phycisphaerales bacterium]|nr:iron chelate uptake ABC transporter family permease subunit [Phycisphaerales bacterium]